MATFGKTFTISQFKAEKNIETLQVVTNPKTEKDFLAADGVPVGAVSSKYNPDNSNKQIVELVTEEAGTIYVLCNGNSDNVKETL